MTDYKVKAEGLNEALSTFFAITPPHLKPIEVQEAPPQQGDLDHWHRCWWFYVNDYGDSCWVLTNPHSVVAAGATHWLAAKHIAEPSDN